MFAKLQIRQPDPAGSGEFGAPRGDHTHRGIDFECMPLTGILSLCDGQVTKLGYPYGDDLNYRYVQVTDVDGLDHRVFYISPDVEVGQTVVEGVTQIGTAQDITSRYPDQGMTNHIHYEIKNGSRYLDPGEHL